MAWAPKGINPANVADASFKFTKLGSAGAESWLSWGFIVLEEDQMKRTKNSRRMHMVFHVESGAVEVKVHENVFTVHRGGVFQVPRGMLILFSASCLLSLSSFSVTQHLSLFLYTFLYDRSHFMLIAWSDNGSRKSAFVKPSTTSSRCAQRSHRCTLLHCRCGWSSSIPRVLPATC
jgi:hypothetical protein